jgi:ParB family transcriptional regulator, chromosome partitioning protein
MCATQRGLGKGLEALLSGSGSDKSHDGDVKQVRLQDIVPNRYQPRKHFSEESLTELSQSISAKGVLQPILVRPLPDDAAQGASKFELIAGERRVRASQLAGKRSIPALVRPMSDEESLVLAMIENLQREDLNPMDEAHGLASIQERLQISQDELAKTLGKSRPAIANSLRLLQLPEPIQDDLRESRLSAGHARSLLGIADPAVQMELRDQIVRNHLSVRQTEQAVTHYKQHGQLPDDSGIVSNTRNRGKTPPPAAHATLVSLQEKMQNALELNVTVKGSPEKGKVIFAFNSRDELRTLLRTLGIEEDLAEA